MIYENVIKTNGPYLGKDGRYRIILKFNDGTKKGMSYPKYLMEMHLERYLEKDETVDHIDGNPLNNELSNLRVLNRQEHCSNDCIRNNSIIVTCTYCGKTFEIEGIDIKVVIFVQEDALVNMERKSNYIYESTSKKKK